MSEKGLGNESLNAIKDWLKAEMLSSIQALYPIGSIYMSTANVSPATFIGGTWEALDEGRVLIGAGTGHPAGETGGEETHILSTAEMPSHNHSGSMSGISVSSAGSHSHSASLSGKSTDDAGTHNHSRGTMNIVGEGVLGFSESVTASGALYVKSGGFSSKVHPSGYSATQPKIEAFDASRSGAWTGNTSSGGSHSHSLSGSVTTGSAGSHTHSISGSVSIGSSGSGGAHNNMQPYLSVYMWKRVA